MTKANGFDATFATLRDILAPQKQISPALKKRMQGKSCFNFITIDPDQAKELTTLTATGIKAFKTVTLPWAQRFSR